MSCASTNSVVKLTLLILTLIVSCAFIGSIVWLIRTKNFTGEYETYYLSRVNMSAVKNLKEISLNPNETDYFKDLLRIEIAMRRVEENSRRLKEYTKSLLWDNKDKSLWCVLFKESDKLKPLIEEKKRLKVDEQYIQMLRDRKLKETIIHLRHHGNHHRKRPDVIPNMPYIK